MTRLLAWILSLVALGLTVGPALLFLNGHLGEAAMKSWMVAGTVVWFAAWPLASKGGAG